MILHAVRGMHVLVPRDMTRAAGFYNTLLKSDEPALVIECLNGYRLKETLPSNLGEFSMPLGKVEVVESGEDLTLVTYGSCVRIAQEAAKQLAELGISIEIVDCQSLLPFDLAHDTLKSIRKTNRLLILDEDVEGGATGFLMQQILEVQGAFRWLDSAPSTLSARPHRPAYGTDGDYFSKPSVDDVVEKVYRILAEAEPGYYPAL
jgi:pyruvate/2-oxoglutarate/acetoin dehydrogenase E1 component